MNKSLKQEVFLILLKWNSHMLRLLDLFKFKALFNTRMTIFLSFHLPKLVKSLFFLYTCILKKSTPFGRSLPVSAIIGSTPPPGLNKLCLF